MLGAIQVAALDGRSGAPRGPPSSSRVVIASSRDPGTSASSLAAVWGGPLRMDGVEMLGRAVMRAASYHTCWSPNCSPPARKQRTNPDFPTSPRPNPTTSGERCSNQVLPVPQTSTRSNPQRPGPRCSRAHATGHRSTARRLLRPCPSRRPSGACQRTSVTFPAVFNHVGHRALLPGIRPLASAVFSLKRPRGPRKKSVASAGRRHVDLGLPELPFDRNEAWELLPWRRRSKSSRSLPRPLGRKGSGCDKPPINNAS